MITALSSEIFPVSLQKLERPKFERNLEQNVASITKVDHNLGASKGFIEQLQRGTSLHSSKHFEKQKSPNMGSPGRDTKITNQSRSLTELKGKQAYKPNADFSRDSVCLSNIVTVVKKEFSTRCKDENTYLLTALQAPLR